MTLPQHLAFALCVAVASYVQNITGFAFGLLLLGLVGLFHLAPLPEATVAVSVLTLINAVMVFRREPLNAERRVLVPALGGSLLGVGAGVALLYWLSDNVVSGLRLLLGLVILACGVLLVLHDRPRGRRSPPGVFGSVGLLAGVLGGLFSTAGPPLVYLFYRQPMPLQQMRHALIAIFAVNAALRLGLMGAAGRIGHDAVWLSLEATPVVMAVTAVMGRWPPRWSPKSVKLVVFALLVLIGAGLVLPSASELLSRWG